ncbi:MAG: DUF4367 domain-containing protein [Eubacteriales bacterium]|nr:DUF4367 domain-containing protein [Eubacteriales bacterium]
MEKKYEDDELDKLIEEQFIKEAQIMEEALFSDEDFEDYDASEEEIRASYQQLMERMKADGVLDEDSEDGADVSVGSGLGDDTDPVGTTKAISSAAAIPLAAGAEGEIPVSNGVGKVVPMPEKRRSGISYKLAKVAGYVFIGGMCVFAASMTSEANRDYVVKHVRYLVGDDTKVVFDNNEENDGANGDEYEAIAKIENKLGIEVPEFLYRPEYFEFYDYEVDFYAQVARMEYLYKNSIIEMRIDKVDEVSSSKIDSMHGETVESLSIDDENIVIEISEIQDEQDQNPAYLAQWERKNAVYRIFGKMDLEELIKMIQRIRFYT